jgi:hypothetical protein
MTRADLLLLWTRHRKASLVFMLAAAVTLFFVARIMVSALYWAGHHEEPVQPWMTVGYIGHSWGFPAHEIDLKAGLPAPVQGHPFTLQEIARQRGVPVAKIVAEVENTLAAMEAERAAAQGGKAP